MVHKVLAALFQRLRNGGIDIHEALKALALFFLEAVSAKAHIVTAEDIMILGHLGSFFLQPLGRNMGQHALKAGSIQLLLQPLGIVGAGAGDLNGFVADIGHLSQRQRQILRGLAKITNGVKLSTDLHN